MTGAPDEPLDGLIRDLRQARGQLPEAKLYNLALLVWDRWRSRLAPAALRSLATAGRHAVEVEGEPFELPAETFPGGEGEREAYLGFLAIATEQFRAEN